VGALRREGITGSSFLEAIRFAAGNRLCVDLAYQGSVRRIEPYSLRRTGAGEILLFAIRSDTGDSRSYRLDRIQGAKVSDQNFSPRYVIELTLTELGAIPPTTRSEGLGRGFTTPKGQITRPARRIARSPRPKFGPTYVYQCPYCQKKFRRSKPSAQLNPHKTPHGYPCAGRTGYLVETKY
jgi:hypothetical protein